ncbi:MAG TPA: phage holin family protein [Propionibacteriaceae bacterium]|nr:phage holin family protein [Propionibacteriaceae bacterium]
MGTLVKQLSEQSTRLIRDELRLAQVEMTAKAKHAGKGAGLAAAAGVVALFGVGALIATVILLLSLVLPAWLAGLIVTLVLFVVSGVLALVGKKQINQVGPVAPERAVESIKTDIAEIKDAARND